MSIPAQFNASAVEKKWYDYWSKKDTWDYSEEIREEFRTLWREIQINNIL